MRLPSRLRQADEVVGLLVLGAVVLFLAAALQAGVLREWLRPSATLRILLPEAGVAGLSVGAEMEVLGTKAGTVRRVVIEPNQRMYAEVQVEDQARVFIRRDSAAVIRKRFGVAGAAYLDVTRGRGAELDWRFAVIEATTERAPTETISAIFDEVQAKVFPILDDVQRATGALAAIMLRIERGEGPVGSLLRDEALARDVTGAVSQLHAILEVAGQAAQEAQRLVASFNAPGGVPQILRRVDQTLATVQQATRDLARATPRLPGAMRNVEEGSSSLPSLLLQTQQTARELEALLTQLRGLWLLGGGGAPPPESLRPGAERVRP